MLNSEAVHRFDTSELVVDSDVRLRPRTCFASSARLSEKRNPLARALLPNNAIKATPLRSAPYRNRYTQSSVSTKTVLSRFGCSCAALSIG